MSFPWSPSPRLESPPTPHEIPRLDSSFLWPAQQAFWVTSDSSVITYQTRDSQLGSCPVLTWNHFGVSALSSLPPALTTLSREDLIAWFVAAQEGTSLLISPLLCTDWSWDSSVAAGEAGSVRHSPRGFELRAPSHFSPQEETLWAFLAWPLGPIPPWNRLFHSLVSTL